LAFSIFGEGDITWPSFPYGSVHLLKDWSFSVGSFQMLDAEIDIIADDRLTNSEKTMADIK
jgi:hypothetical protein